MAKMGNPYTVCMNAKNNNLQEYIELCKLIYERMERDGTWPWEDSTNQVDMVESKDNPKNDV